MDCEVPEDPPAFGRVHPKWKTPYVAILVQAVLATQEDWEKERGAPE